MDNTKQQDFSFEKKKTTEKKYNSDQSKILVLEYINTMNPTKEIKYTVFNTKNSKILKKGTFVGTNIKWSDNNTLKCFIQKGMIKKENSELLLETTTQNNYELIKIN